MKYIETEIELKIKDTLADSFEEDATIDEMNVLIEDHIKDFCERHRVKRQDIKILAQHEI